MQNKKVKQFTIALVATILLSINAHSQDTIYLKGNFKHNTIAKYNGDIAVMVDTSFNHFKFCSFVGGKELCGKRNEVLIDIFINDSLYKRFFHKITNKTTYAFYFKNRFETAKIVINGKVFFIKRYQS